MKIISKFFNSNFFNERLSNLTYKNFSLFVDDIPKTQEDLSPLNILTLAEPNEYFGLHDWAIQNQNTFSAILTWNDKLLNQCPNAVFLPFGSTWFLREQYEKFHEKKFELAHLCGVLLKSYGHQMRHEILARKDEFIIPTNFYSTIGDRHNEEDARIGKEIVFGNSQYGIVIENFSHRGYFSEKILDCFLMKTIPVYWGCSNIGDFFNSKGIIEFRNTDDLLYQINSLTSEHYENCKEIIEENYQRALKYVNYPENIVNKVTEIFELNEL